MVNEISITGWMMKFSEVPWASMLTKGGEFDEENNYTLHNSAVGGVVFTSDTLPACQSTITIPLYEWTFVAFTWDGYNAKMYIDGVADIAAFMPLSGVLQPNNSSLYIGVDYPGDTEYFFGCLDDIRIYNRDLTPIEVLLLYDSTYTQTTELPSTIRHNIKIYPNPSANIVNLSVNAAEPINGTILFYDQYGKFVKEIQAGKLQAGENKLLVDVSCLESGIYYLKLSGGSLYRTQKLVIAR